MSQHTMTAATVTIVVDGNAYYMDGAALMSGPVMAASERDDLGSILEHGADEYCEVDFVFIDKDVAAQCRLIQAALKLLITA
jgi:hypothetical protein